jgi:hypothetical protein
MVWLSPLRQEKLPLPLPDPALQNRNLALYTEAIANTAKNKDEGFIDLFHLKTESGTPLLTDNGIHLTADGYWVTAQTIDNGMGRKEKPWRRTLKAAGDSTSWEVTDETLPFPLPPDSSFPVPLERQRILKIEGLAPGTHTLSIDDKAVATAEAAAWALGVRLSSGPEYDQVEELRKAIIAKNRLYFYRWRPQNETYLFGFRKYEQGKNAVEIPQFDPLVAEKEAEIVKQAQPRKHVYKIQQAAKP